MANELYVRPAFTRDYVHKWDAADAWESGIDFVIDDIKHGLNGQLINKHQLAPNVKTVIVRFNKGRLITTLGV